MGEKPRHCYVYIFCYEDGDSVKGPCKIGITKSLASRLAQVQTGSPHKIVFLGSLLLAPRELARDFERGLHEMLSTKRLHGEWFDLEPGQAAGLLAHLARMLFEGMAPSSEILEDLCHKSGAYQLIRYFHMSEGRTDLALKDYRQ